MSQDEEMTCICEGCGICTKMERETVFLKDDIFSIISDQNARCEACNSYADGSTLKVVQPFIKKICEQTRLSTLEEVEKLMTESNVHGFCITKKGLEELKQRGDGKC